MKMNRISSYVLVYLLTSGITNLLVPVRGEGGSAAGTKTGIDINIKKDTKTKDDYEYQRVGDYVTYTAKGNKAFKLVKDDKVDIWNETDASNYSGRVEVEFLDNEGKAVTIFLSDNRTKLFKKDGKDKPWSEIDLTKVTSRSINIDYPHQSYFYKHETKGMTSTFTAKTGFILNAANEYINSKKTEVWKATDENDSTKKIDVEHLGNHSKAVTIYLADNKTRVFMKTGLNEQWSEFDLAKVNCKTINIGYEHDSFTYTNEIKDKVRTFTAKSGFGFNGANDYVDGDKYEVWKPTNDKEYATKIVSDPKKVTIHLADGTTKEVAKGTNGKWPSSCLGPKTPIYLSLKAKEGTDQFNYNKQDKVVTFTAKGNKGFKSVKTGKNGDVLVWSTDNASEFASKVVLDGRGKKEKKVTIHLPNNTTKVFTRDGKGKPWNDVSPQPKDSAKTTGTTPAGGAGQSGGSTK